MSTSSRPIRENPETRAYIRWTPAEYLRLAAHAFPYVSPSVDTFTLLKKGMRGGLPRSRWRPDEDLKRLATPSQSLGLRNALKRIEQMNETEREGIRGGEMILIGSRGPQSVEQAREERDNNRTHAPPPTAPTKAPPKEGEKGQRIFWTEREWALVTRRVQYWRRNNGDTRKLSTLLFAAQAIELPPDRRRPITSLYGAAHIQEGIKRGESFMWTLADRYPFDPARTTYVDPQAAKSEEDRQGPSDLDIDPHTNPHDPTYVPPPEDGGPPLELRADTPPAVPQSTQREVAFSMPAQPVSTLSEAASAFGDTLMGAMSKLLAAQEQMVLRAVQQRIDASSTALANVIAQHLHSAITGTVHELLEKELGGPVAAPSAGTAPQPQELKQQPQELKQQEHPGDDEDAEIMRRAAEANAAIMQKQAIDNSHTVPQYQAPQPPAPKFKLKVDVIGLFPRQIEDVKRAINGHAELRFIDHDHPQHWTPGHADQVIVVSKGVNALILNRLRKEGVRPLVLREAAATGVINAINELRKANE